MIIFFLPQISNSKDILTEQYQKLKNELSTTHIGNTSDACLHMLWRVIYLTKRNYLKLILKIIWINTYILVSLLCMLISHSPDNMKATKLQKVFFCYFIFLEEL